MVREAHNTQLCFFSSQSPEFLIHYHEWHVGIHMTSVLYFQCNNLVVFLILNRLNFQSIIRLCWESHLFSRMMPYRIINASEPTSIFKFSEKSSIFTCVPSHNSALKLVLFLLISSEFPNSFNRSISSHLLSARILYPFH